MPAEPSCWKTRVAAGAGSWLRRRACASGRAGWTDVDAPVRASCKTTRLRASAGRRELRAPLQAHFRRCGVLRRVLDRMQRPSTSACSRAASGWRCTCMPATATCTPTSRSTATTTTCCRPRTTPSNASWRWPRSLDGVISGEHGIGITKLEFLTDDGDCAPFRRLQGSRVDPRGPLQSAASCYVARRCSRL